MNDNKKDFFKLYNTSVKEIWKLKKNEIRLFLNFCSVMKFGSGMIILDPNLRKFIAESLGIEMKTFYNLISSLKKKGFISSSDGVYYYVNQAIASKG